MKRKTTIVFCIMIIGYIAWRWFFQEPRVFAQEGAPVQKHVMVVDDGISFQVETNAADVATLLQAQFGGLRANDIVYPDLSHALFGGEIIEVRRSKSISLILDGKKESIQTTARNAHDLLNERRVTLAQDDFVLPDDFLPLVDSDTIEVVRVVVKEEKEFEPIPFEIKETTDDELGWRVKKIARKGEAGSLQKTYKTVYHNGKIVKKTLEGTVVVKESVSQNIVRGTYVKTGKKHTGFGTWYSHTGTLAAASPWLPIGSYARVTNASNGTSVMVQINDRGPFGKNRIIDLDRVAFEKIASVGAGVIDVIVEEVLN